MNWAKFNHWANYSVAQVLKGNVFYTGCPKNQLSSLYCSDHYVKFLFCFVLSPVLVLFCPQFRGKPIAHINLKLNSKYKCVCGLYFFPINVTSHGFIWVNLAGGCLLIRDFLAFERIDIENKIDTQSWTFLSTWCINRKIGFSVLKVWPLFAQNATFSEEEKIYWNQFCRIYYKRKIG